MACSIPGHEDKAEHGRSGLCQACYRRARRRVLDPQVGTRKPGPKPTGAPSHKRLPDEVKEQRRAARLEREKCPNGHDWVPENLYQQPGQDMPKCRLCLRHAQQRSKGRPLTHTPLAPSNADKIQCKWGHDFAVHGYEKKDGSRGCRPCHRESRLMRTYGLRRGQYDEMYEEQSGHCAGCEIELEEGKNLAVDHDHATGAVRGLLCNDCNLGQGKLKDSPEILRRLADYLEKHRRG